MKKLGYLLTGVVLGATLFGGAQATADGILAQRSSAPFFLNGSPVEVETYLIHNNHFFMLRDIAKLVDFGVTWNAESGTVSIRQVIGLCLTAFLQSTILVAGLMAFRNHALLGLGLMLSAGEVPRIAGAFGMDTTTRANMMGAVYTAQMAINTTKSIAAIAAK